MGERAVHLICNSHLDPVWLWEWQEGAAQALALARSVTVYELPVGVVTSIIGVPFFIYLYRRVGRNA